MTVLGAVVFGGFLVLGVLWLLISAPDGDVDRAWTDSHWTKRINAAPAGGALTGTQ